MNVNPNATVVLCYGDSNTYGQRADVKGGRWPADVRWTGVLQQNLGDGYSVIEEGLPSRTTDLDYDQKPGRNGRAYLAPCLGSHNPIDVVVLMLGTNDLKVTFDRSPQQIADALKELVDDIYSYARNKDGHPPKVVLISPIHIGIHTPAGPHYDQASIDKSHQLASVIQTVAAQQKCYFIDAAEVAKPGEDDIHLTKDSHGPLAHKIAEALRQAS
jgi:lysophospholipase L1-like esterase